MEPRYQPLETNSSPALGSKGTATAWWDDDQASGWARVKEAFLRDWEQTKADFSKDAGLELKQNVGDTVMQAVGTEPIPPIDEKTHLATVHDEIKAHDKLMDESRKASDEVARAQAEIDAERAKLEERRRQIQSDLAKEQVKASLKIAKALHTANEHIGKAHEKIEEALAHRDEARGDWMQAEREARYGYAARTQFPQFAVWTIELEYVLRDNWDQLNTGRSWDEARLGVRRGWDYSQQPRH